uniref:RNA-directed DNA polymerase n=1 Tax=Ceratitis capitata TaxID=7213 RepID=W8C8Q1_CERCA
MDKLTILKLSKAELQDELSKLGLHTVGLKTDLQNRLLEHFGMTVDADDDSVYDEAQESIGNVVREPRSIFTLRDIEDSLVSFTGNGQPTVEKWLEIFEENATAVSWNSLQKFIYSKQLLKGAAKIFIRSQSGVTNWVDLKRALLDEFGVQYSAIEVHRQLRNRRKRDNEDMREYLYSLKEIGKPINLDERSLIEYFIEGIPDTRIGKCNLYQAKTLRDLKEQIDIYEKIKSRKPTTAINIGQKTTTTISNNTSISAPRKCFSCGESSHLARSCPKNIRCFKCNQLGHRAAQCSTENPLIKVGKSNVNTMGNKEFQWSGMGKNLLFKDIKLNNYIYPGLIDTGCEVCLIRDDILHKVGNFKLNADKRQLVGIGESELTTLGSFAHNIYVDDIEIEVNFHVTRSTDIRFAVVIGSSVLNQVDLFVTKDGVQFHLKNKGLVLAKTDSPVEPDTCNVDKFNSEKQKENNASQLIHEFKDICMMAGTDTESKIQIELTYLNQNLAARVNHIIDSYNPIKGAKSPVEMKILLIDEQPVYERPRRVPHADKAFIEEQVSEWLRDGIIQPSVSEYASPVVLVSKKDGSKRLCCDYRRLNQKIVRDNFPMPLIDDVLDRLQSAKVFTTLDLRNGFFHVPLASEHRKYTSFVTHSGQYEFLFVPFGISNSPAVFTRFITAVFRELINNGTVITYMDDLIIPAEDEIEGLGKFEQVLEVAAKNNLSVKWSKCQFLRRKVTFLGYVIENSSIRPSEGKISAVNNFPLPTDKKSLQRFLGLTSYFRRFVEGYAVVAKPLSDLLRKDNKFVLQEEQLASFQQLKIALVNAPVLNLYNPKAVTEVHTDACKFGYGAVLLQKNFDDQELHPIQYMSRRTKPNEELFHSYELEALAVVEAVKKWRTYLLGIKFKIITDCNAFALTLRKREVPPRVSRWALFLQDYDYSIEHRSGSRMKHVDALSRISCLMLEDTLSHRLKQTQVTDDWIKAVKKALEAGPYEDFYVKRDVLFKDPVKELIVVPALMEEEVIRMAHRQGHFSVTKTVEAIDKTFFIPKLRSKVERIVKSCVECIVITSKNGKKEGYLCPIEKEDRPLATYHVDHVGPMETTAKQYNYILVVIDGFSKFVWLYPTKNTGAEAVVDKLKQQEAIFGNPKRIVSDRGSAFTSAIFKQYCESQDIQHFLITTGVPRGNGQVERIHKIIIPMIAKLSQENASHWYKHIARVQQVLNSTPPRSTRVSPFKILTGMEMRLPQLNNIREIFDKETIAELNQVRDETRAEAKRNIEVIQEENRKSFNQRRKAENKYPINTLVAIKRTQYGTGMKLRAKYLGPYKVIREMRHGRYEVEKVGDHEGPHRTTTVAEYMKPWI